MLEREAIIQELWSRLASVTGVAFTARNPKQEPSVDNLPCIQFWEMDDKVEEESARGGYPSFKRSFDVVVEPFVLASTDASASKVLNDFIIEIKKQVYRDGVSLGGLCRVSEAGSSRILRPPVGENVIGIGITFTFRYVETVANLFN
jgi:hypothetical protein